MIGRRCCEGEVSEQARKLREVRRAALARGHPNLFLSGFRPKLRQQLTSKNEISFMTFVGSEMKRLRGGASKVWGWARQRLGVGQGAGPGQGG